MNGDTVPQENLENGKMSGTAVAAAVPTVNVGSLTVPRIINGMLEVAGDHGHINQQKAVEQMLEHYRAGLTAFEMADMYGPAEQIYGQFIDKLRHDEGELALNKVQGITKLSLRPGQNTRKSLESLVNRSLQLMKVIRVDCMQVFWWDYSDRSYQEALQHLGALQREGKIGEVSVSDFDKPHLKELVERNMKISSNQVQYSLIDTRPAVKMAPFCEANDIQMLAYGVLAGGFITDRYLGKPEPLGKSELNNPSLVKYKEVIDLWGGWGLFQELLAALSTVAKRHNVTIANVATRWVLDQPGVGAVILGCPFGGPNSSHLAENLQSLQLQLTKEDLDAISKVTKRGHDLMEAIGGVGDEFH